MPPMSLTKRLRPLVVVALLGLFLPILASVPVEAHGTKSGTAARAGSTRFDVYLTEYDLAQDGHCARGRFHLGGQWVTVATDCTHSPVGNGVHSGYWGAQGTISVSTCLSGHTPGGSSCYYGQYKTFDQIDLGNVP